MLVNIGKGIELNVDVVRLGFPTDLPPVAAHTVMIGLRNQLMDCHAAITAKDSPTDYIEKSKAIAEKKLEAMYDGEIRTVTTREGDPVKAEALRLIAKALKAKDAKDGAKRDDKARLVEARELLALAKPDSKVMVQARKNVEETKALSIDDLV